MPGTDRAVSRHGQKRQEDMKMTGKLKALFEFELHGVGLPRPADFKISGGSAHLEIGNPAKLSVDIDGIDEVTAQAEASRVARKLYERLLLRLSQIRNQVADGIAWMEMDAHDANRFRLHGSFTSR
jgi:hypothetical protein